MSGGRKTRTRARRRVKVRSALLLTLAVCALTVLARAALSQSGALKALPTGAGVLVELLETLLLYGGGAALGLCVLDGDRRALVPMRRLSRAQTLYVALLGVLAVCPVTLLHEMLMALCGIRYQPVWAGPQTPSWFLAKAVRSALIAPVCEELFFRGYLLSALRPYGEGRAALAVSVCFALVHGLDGGASLPMMALLGLLFCLLTLRTGSLLAPILTHACYNLTLLVLSYSGLSALFAGLTLISCALRLLGCAAFAAVLRLAYAARGTDGQFALWAGGGLKKREIALLAAAAALLIMSFVTGG